MSLSFTVLWSRLHESSYSSVTVTQMSVINTIEHCWRCRIQCERKTMAHRPAILPIICRYFLLLSHCAPTQTINFCVSSHRGEATTVCRIEIDWYYNFRRQLQDSRSFEESVADIHSVQCERSISIERKNVKNCQFHRKFVSEKRDAPDQHFGFISRLSCRIKSNRIATNIHGTDDGTMVHEIVISPATEVQSQIVLFIFIANNKVVGPDACWAIPKMKEKRVRHTHTQTMSLTLCPESTNGKSRRKVVERGTERQERPSVSNNDSNDSDMKLKMNAVRHWFLRVFGHLFIVVVVVVGDVASPMHLHFIALTCRFTLNFFTSTSSSSARFFRLFVSR